MTNLEKLYRDIAPKLNLSVEEVSRICRWQFAVAAEEMKKGDFTPVRWPLLGTMTPIPKRTEGVLEKKIKQNFQAFGYHAY